MTGRLALVAVVALVAASALIGGLHGERPTLVDAGPASAVVTAALPNTAAMSTWYCAAAVATVPSDDADGDTEARSDVADRHDVVVANTTGQPVDGVVTMFGGEMAPRPAPEELQAPPSAESTSPPSTAPEPSTDETATASEPERRPFKLGPHSRLTLPLQDGERGAATAAVVEATGGGVAVEQQISGVHGSDVAPCSSTTASEWHFAAGSTERNAREVLVLFNPFQRDVNLDGTFTSDDSVREPLRWQGLPVPARSVVAVDVGDDVTRREQLAAEVRAHDGALVVSRVQAVAAGDGAGGQDTADGTGAGLSLTVGQPAPRPTWTFAAGPLDEGTGERLILANPSGSGSRDAEVEVVVRTAADADQPAPQPVPFVLTVRAGRTEVLDLAAQDRLSVAAAHVVTVWSRNGVPVVAERVLQHPSRTAGGVTMPAELSVGGGTTTAAVRWLSPVVVHGDGLTTRYHVANVDPFRSAEVSLEVQGGLAGTTRPPELQNVPIPPGGQVELAVPTEGVIGPGDTASVVVEATLPVVVERALLRQGHLRALAPLIPVTG